MVKIGASDDVAFLPGDEAAICIAGSSKIRRLDAATGEVTASASWRNPCHVVIAGDHVVVANTSGGSRVYLGADLSLVGKARGREEGPRPVVAPDGRSYVVATWGGHITHHAIPTGEVLGSVRGTPVFGTATGPGGDVWLLFTDDEWWVESRTWPPLEEGRRLIEGDRLLLDGIAVGPKGRVALLHDDRVRVLADEIRELPADQGGTGCGLAWSPTGALAFPHDDEIVVVNADLSEIARYDVPYPSAVTFSSDGSRLAIGSWEQGVIVDLPPH